jgi:hypothetical protein
MIKPDFETTYTALLKQLTQIDYLAKNTLLGATIQDNDPVIPFYGIPTGFPIRRNRHGGQGKQ